VVFPWKTRAITSQKYLLSNDILSESHLIISGRPKRGLSKIDFHLVRNSRIYL
jgi:hypothetical protein